MCTCIIIIRRRIESTYRLVKIIELPLLLYVFTPLCVSVDGLLGEEADFFIHRLCDFLSIKWERPFSLVMNWIQAHLSFAILWATLLCVRGSCTKW